MTAAGATFVDYTDGDMTRRLRALAPGGFAAIADNVGGESLRTVAALADEALALVESGHASGKVVIDLSL